MVALVCFAILTIGLAGPIRSAGWLPVLLTARLANAATVAIVVVVVIAFRPRIALPLLDRASGRPLGRVHLALLAAVVGGVLDIAGFVAFAVGLEQAPAWIVGLASSFGPVVSVVVAIVLWGERLQPSQWLGLVGIGLGLAAVALP